MRGSRVAAVIGHGALTFDLPIPCEVFGLDRSDIASPWYEFRLVAAEPGPVHTSTGFTIEAALDAGTDPDATPLERFEQYRIQVLDTFASHRRVWAATLEIFGQVERMPEFRRFVGDALQDARRAWALMLSGIDAAADQKKALAVGSFYQVLLTGALSQWLIDPEHAPSGQDLTLALREIVSHCGQLAPATKASGVKRSRSA